jgi:PAS domain S-box-containing protein
MNGVTPSPPAGGPDGATLLEEARGRAVAERLRYQELFDFAPDAYLVTNLHGVIEEGNHAAAALLHSRKEFLAGKPLSFFVDGPDRREFYGRLNGLIRRGQGGDLWETALHPPRGRRREVMVSVAVGPAGLRWLLRDVTAWRQSERLAAVGQMVTGLAHESRNALQRTHACLERLRWRLADRPDAVELLDRAQKAQDDLQRLLDQVRAYAAPIAPDLAPLNLADVWREAWDQVTAVALGQAGQLAEDAAGVDLTLVGDRFRLGQVFRNLFENAFAACPGRVRVTVACRDASLNRLPALEVAVRDNGPGLDAGQRGRLFEPFFSTRPHGTGLGLPIARRIVEAHGGALTAAEAPPPGAAFVVTLPRNRT